MKKRLLITGIAGFIGYHAALALQKKYEVVGIDSMDPYGLPSLKEERKRRLLAAGIELFVQDVRDTAFLQSMIEERRIDKLLHLAAQAGVRYSIQNPAAYIEANISGFLSVLEAVKKSPAIKVVYASSSSVYGSNEKVPYGIEDRTDSPVSFYAVTKKTNELMASCYHHLYGIDLCGLRFFTVYGPWGRSDMAYFSFTEKLMRGERIDLYNYGNCSRDFTYIDDIVGGIESALETPMGNRLYNLGGHSPVALSEFVAILEKWTGKSANLRLLPMQPGDVVRTYADISLSEKELGFVPKVPLEEGLARFVEWYKEWGLSNNS